MRFLTCFWLLPQKEPFSRSPPSPMRATGTAPHDSRRRLKPAPAGCLRLHYVELEGTPSRPQMGQDTATASPGSGRGETALARLQDGVDQAVLDRCGRGQDLVAVDVAADLLDVLA